MYILFKTITRCHQLKWRVKLEIPPQSHKGRWTKNILPTLSRSVTCKHLFYGEQYLFLSVLWRPSLDMSDQVLIKMSCQGGGERAGGVGLSLAGAAGGDMGHRSTRCVWSCAQNLLAVGARQRINRLETVSIKSNCSFPNVAILMFCHISQRYCGTSWYFHLLLSQHTNTAHLTLTKCA